MLLHPLQYGSGTDPTFSHRGLVQKLPVGISTEESHSDFWHHLWRKSTPVICNRQYNVPHCRHWRMARLGFKINKSIHLNFLNPLPDHTLPATLQT